MQKIIPLILTLVMIASCSTQKQCDKIYREASLMPVTELLKSLFSDKDIVFLGENHRIKQQVMFVGSIIPILQKQGVHILFSEFANYSDSILADSLVTATEYNEELAREILHRCEWDWAYQEYADIYKAAWQVNRKLHHGEKPFRIIGLQPDLNHAVIQSPSDWDNPEKISLYWNQENNSWLDIIEKEAILKNRKAMVHCGLHHSFTRYLHPIVIDGAFIRFEHDREGTQVHNRYPGKTATVVLYNHLPCKPALLSDGISPFNGVIDSIISILPEKHRQFGFITSKSPLGAKTDTASYYSIGYGTLAMKDFCDAYVVLGPVCEYETATLMENFITAKNLENTIEQAYPYNFTREWTVQSCNDSIRKWYREEKVFLEKIKNCRK